MNHNNDITNNKQEFEETPNWTRVIQENSTSKSHSVKFLFEEFIYDDSISKLIEKINFESVWYSNSFNGQLSDFEKLKSLNSIELQKLRNSVKHFSCSRSNSLLDKIKSLSIDELIELYNKFNCSEEDEELKTFLESYIKKKNQSDWILKLIGEIEKTIKFIQSKNIKLSRNKRFYFRKIQGFLFKNLDDYHAYSIIQNVKFKVTQPSILILNNRIHETKYFKTN